MKARHVIGTIVLIGGFFLVPTVLDRFKTYQSNRDLVRFEAEDRDPTTELNRAVAHVWPEENRPRCKQFLKTHLWAREYPETWHSILGPVWKSMSRNCGLKIDPPK